MKFKNILLSTIIILLTLSVPTVCLSYTHEGMEKDAESIGGIEYHTERASWSTKRKVALTYMTLGQLIDVISTVSALDDGCIETNPILGEDPNVVTLVAVKVVGGVALYYFLEKILEDSEYSEGLKTVAYSIVGTSGLVTGIHNFNVECN